MGSGSALDPELADYFGTLAGTMLALFQAVTDGQEWREMLNPLMREISPWMAVPFCIYIAFTVFALLPLRFLVGWELKMWENPPIYG